MCCDCPELQETELMQANDRAGHFNQSGNINSSQLVVIAMTDWHNIILKSV